MLALIFAIASVTYFAFPFDYLETVGVERKLVGVLCNIVTLRWHGRNNVELWDELYSNWIGDWDWSQIVNDGDTFNITIPIAQSWVTIQYGFTKTFLEPDGTLITP